MPRPRLLFIAVAVVVVALLASGVMLVVRGQLDGRPGPGPPAGTPVAEDDRPPEPVSVALSGTEPHDGDNAALFGRPQPPPDVAAAEAAAKAARQALEDYLNAQFVDPGSRFSAEPVAGLLAPAAQAALTDSDRPALGQIDLDVERVDAGAATAQATVFQHGPTVHAVTLEFEAPFSATLPDDEAATLRQHGAVLFTPVDGAWRALATDVDLEVERPDAPAPGDPATPGAGGESAAPPGPHQTRLRPAYAHDGILTILALGSDMGPPHRPGDPLRGRADGIHVIAIDPAHARATIVNIPRDSFIGGRKANAHLALGGPEAMRAAIASYSGLEFDFWALTTFLGIERIVDDLGGADIVIERVMVDRFSHSNFPTPGPITVDGVQALAFLRNRKSLPDGDFGRSRHHGDFMRFVHHQVAQRHANLPELTRLAASMSRNTVSNIPPEQYLPLAMLAVRMESGALHQVPLGGSIGSAGGASIVRLAPGDTFDRIRAGQVGPP